MTQASTEAAVAGHGSPEPEHWAARYLDAMAKLGEARAFLTGEPSRYTARFDAVCAAQLDSTAVPADVLAQMARIAEAMCTAVRDEAIGLYQADQICEDGLTDFLEAAGMEPYDS